MGGALAAKLKWRFIDTDTLIEQEAGVSITRVFGEAGERAFRAREAATIRRICRLEKHVIATGGGAIVSKDNARQLKASGTIICLAANPEVIRERLKGSGDRPLLHGPDPLGTIRALQASRSQAYARADATIDTSELTVDEVVHAILEIV